MPIEIVVAGPALQANNRGRETGQLTMLSGICTTNKELRIRNRLRCALIVVERTFQAVLFAYKYLYHLTTTLEMSLQVPPRAQPFHNDKERKNTAEYR